MIKILFGFVLGWMVATIGVGGVVRIGEKVTSTFSNQVVELAK